MVGYSIIRLLQDKQLVRHSTECLFLSTFDRLYLVLKIAKYKVWSQLINYLYNLTL